MSPYLGTIAGYPIPVFALVLDAAAVVGVVLAARLASGRGVPATRFLDASLVVLLAALAGSRLWYAAAHLQEFAPNPVAVIALWEGGLALPGAVTLGALALHPAARAARVPAGALAGAAAVGLAAAQAIGRLGCIPAGCGAGLPAAQLPVPAPVLPLADAAGVVAERFPSQLVEAGGELVLAFALWLAWRSGRPAAQVAALYLVGYGALRFALEPFRADSTSLGGLALASAWALLAFTCGAALLLARGRKERHVHSVSEAT